MQPVSVSYFLGLGGLWCRRAGTGGLFGANPLDLPTANDIPRNLLNANTSNTHETIEQFNQQEGQ